jgi:hypothetical protein
MRLFQQKNVGDWAGVFEQIEAALKRVRSRWTVASPEKWSAVEGCGRPR